jgi:hypothetical protein
MPKGSAVLPVLAIAATAGLLTVQPFHHACNALDWMFGAPPEWTQVKWNYRDPRTQATCRGEKPLESFQQLSGYWRQTPGRRVVFIGNSQMHMVSLAEGEAKPVAPEKAYVDYLADATRGQLLPYRLSAPGMSYAEALWLTRYLALREDLRPDTLVLQLNYQSFYNAGIRHGLQTLLSDPRFRREIEAEAAGASPVAEIFREALQAYEKAGARDAAPGDKTIAERLEEEARTALQRFPTFAGRHEEKDNFLEMLYRLRVYVLQMKATTARSITGTRWIRSRAAVEQLAEAARAGGIRLVVFHAPVNPDVQLYRTEKDRRSYREFADALAKERGVRVLDFENAVPARLWGRWMNGPDPLHLSRAGHQLLARNLQEQLRKPEGGN